MNNELLAQQQALLNQVVQNAQHIQSWVLALYAVFCLVGFVITAFVIYLFYARLRDIAGDLRKLRIAYEVAHTAASRSQPPRDHTSESAWPAPLKPLPPSPEDVKYMPKAK